MENDSYVPPADSDKQHIKKTMIALDINPAELKIAKSGYFFSKAIGAEIILMHVIAKSDTHYSKPEYSPVVNLTGYQHPVYLTSDTNSVLKTAAQNFLEKSKLILGDDHIQTFVAEGDFAEEILYAAKKLDVDLIVMGTKNKSLFKKIIFGSIVQKVLKHTSVPVVIFPSGTTTN